MWQDPDGERDEEIWGQDLDREQDSDGLEPEEWEEQLDWEQENRPEQTLLGQQRQGELEQEQKAIVEEAACNDATQDTPETEINEEDAKRLLFEAMENGYVTSQSIVLVFIGIAGSGKSSFKRVVLNLPPEEVRVSTSLAEATMRNISISKAIIGDSDSVKWEVVTSEELLKMLADAIKEGVLLESTSDLLSNVLPKKSSAHVTHSSESTDKTQSHLLLLQFLS